MPVNLTTSSLLTNSTTALCWVIAAWSLGVVLLLRNWLQIIIQWKQLFQMGVFSILFTWRSLQGRNEGGNGSTILWALNHYGGAKSLQGTLKDCGGHREVPHNAADTFFGTVHLLPKYLRFEHVGAKLASCTRWHLTSQCSSQLVLWFIHYNLEFDFFRRPCFIPSLLHP